MYIEQLTKEDIINFLKTINLELNRNKDQNQMLECFKETKKAIKNSENFIICFCDKINPEFKDNILDELVSKVEGYTSIPFGKFIEKYSLNKKTITIEDFFAYDSFENIYYFKNYYDFMVNKFGEKYKRDLKKYVEKLNKKKENEKE